MPTTTTQPTTHMPPAPPTAPAPVAAPKLWMMLGLVLAGLVAVIVAGIVLLGGGDDVARSSDPAVDVIDDAPAAPPSDDTDTLMAAFVGAWEEGDWAELERLATPPAIEVARDWFVDGIAVAVVAPMSSGTTELLVTNPADGSAAVFTASVADVSGSLSIVELVFGGDAGSGHATPASDDGLTVTQPRPGDLFASGSSLAGETTTETVEYRLIAGGATIAVGTVLTDDGTFSTTVSFTNTCCIEMTLEVTQPGAERISIPLSFPEPG